MQSYQESSDKLQDHYVLLKLKQFHVYSINMELSVWKCKSGKLYQLRLKDGTRYVAKHLVSLEFLILLKIGNTKPIHIRYSFDYTDKVYTYKTAKERAQEKMEARALRLILCKVTGDETFIW